MWAWGVVDNKLHYHQGLRPIGRHRLENVEDDNPKELLHFLMNSFYPCLVRGPPREADSVTSKSQSQEFRYQGVFNSAPLSDLFSFGSTPERKMQRASARLTS